MSWQRDGDAMADIIGRVEDKATFAEMETLSVIAGESAKKAMHFLTMGNPHRSRGRHQTHVKG